MDRRRFLQNLAVTTSAMQNLVSNANTSDFAKPTVIADLPTSAHDKEIDTDGYTQVSEFKAGPAVWKVYEDLRTRDGSLVFKSSQGARKLLSKSAEPAFDEATAPYLGLKLDEIGTTPRDVLADKLLEKRRPRP